MPDVLVNDEKYKELLTLIPEGRRKEFDDSPPRVLNGMVWTNSDLDAWAGEEFIYEEANAYLEDEGFQNIVGERMQDAILDQLRTVEQEMWGSDTPDE